MSRRVHDRGLVAHAADHQVDPLVRRELARAACRYSSRSKVASWMGVSLSIQNGYFPFDLLVVLEAHVDLGPDAARQEPVELAHVVVRDVDELVPEVRHLGPVARSRPSRTFTLSMKVCLPFSLTLLCAFVRLVRPDVVLGQGVVDDLQPHLDGHLVGWTRSTYRAGIRARRPEHSRRP